MRILFLSNIPTPYQIDFWSSVQQSAAVSAVFLAHTEPRREWHISLPEWACIISSTRSSAPHQILLHLSNFKPDVIVIGGYRLPLVWYVVLFALFNHIRFFFWLEKPLPATRYKSLFRRLTWRITLPLADGVLCIGQSAQRIYSPYARSTLNLPYSIDVARYSRRRFNSYHIPLKFLFVGQYTERKGLVPLLKAFSSFSPELLTLSLAGSGNLASLVHDYVSTFSHIHDYGFVQPTELPYLLASHDVFILPSRHDGWAVVVLEAMAAGLPVISTIDTGSFEDLLSTTGVGQRCEPTTASIKAAVSHYIGQPSGIRREGNLCYDILCSSDSNVLNSSKKLLHYLS